MKKNYSKSSWLNLLLVIIILIVVSVGCKSRAKGKVITHSCDSEVGIVNNEIDYGVTVNLKVKNVGESGEIKIVAAISTSEGEWQKKQTLIFKAGEEKKLSYFFHEPTINVRSVQCQIGVFPDDE